ncbi:hypothetical protein DLAC_03308 [Tieghemostelium lacteum]|uniref:Uncharacterized protein n=1 Tax=Tieghemostelium lacteum TaxID=361077 RepID=A0A152A1Q1_TIELA|nr:hypothetical protein DLAC_03308 [Tieghemostelium lacteum]|eukprot:KYR00156.1 hypothetical protein DLAC_03308 [Tieghemostelium lacteum]
MKYTLIVVLVLIFLIGFTMADSREANCYEEHDKTRKGYEEIYEDTNDVELYNHSIAAALQQLKECLYPYNKE